MLIRARLPSIAVWLGAMAAFIAAPALAADTANGSKNFRTPAAVPNYFSNEAGPMLGGAAESRRGELYNVQANPQQHQVAAIPVPARAPRAAVAHSRSGVARQTRHSGRHRVVHEARSRAGAHGVVREAHSRAGVHRIAVRNSTSRHAAAPARAKVTRVGSNHGHSRG